MTIKRSKLLQMGEDAIKAVKLPFILKKEKKNLELWVLEREQSVATLDAEINELKSTETLDTDAILNKIDEKELAERRLTQGEDLMKELFD